MHTHQRPHLFMLLLLGIIACPLTSNAAKKFRWKLVAGDKLKAELTQDMKQTLTFGEKTIEIPNTMKMSMIWIVDEVNDDGEFQITQEVTRITMSMKVPAGEDVKYDSDSKDELEGTAAKIGEMMKPMVGAKFLQTMNDRGRIVDMKVPKEALQGLAGNPIMKQFFSDDAFKDMMSKSSPVLPEEEIDKGFTWENSTSNKTPVGNLNMKANYTYDGEGDDNIDKFSAKIEISFGEGGGPLGAEIKIVDQDNKGTMLFDSEAGFFKESTLSQNLNMEVSAGGNTFKQRIETNIKMTMRRVGN